MAAPTLPEGTVEFWTFLFSRPSPPIPDNIVGGDINILGPITIEVRWLKKTIDRFSAPRPDGLRATELLQIPDERLQQAYTQVLEVGSFSGLWKAARMTLIPKNDNPQDLAEFRPIMMTSCLTRGLHKILAHRLAESVEVDNMQRGFKAEDGVAANLSLIKNMIQTAKTTSIPLYIEFVDFKKAFDSVHHGAILEAAGAAGLENNSILYLKSVYKNLRTEVLG